MKLPSIRFHSHIVRGSGRGAVHGVPTLNLDVRDVPSSLPEGIYACRASLQPDRWDDAVMHWGPRPVFRDVPSCEIHLVDRQVHDAPDSVEVDVGGFLRPVQNFPTPDALYAQIARDIADARAMLHTWDCDPSND